MRLDPELRQLFLKVNRRLVKGMNLTEIAADLSIPYDNLYAKIDRAGYRVEVDRTARLVPKAAPSLEPTA